MRTAKFVTEIIVTDKGINTTLTVYQHEGGGIFAIDSSFLDQCCDDDTYPIIPDPFSDVFNMEKIMLCDE